MRRFSLFFTFAAGLWAVPAAAQVTTPEAYTPERWEVAGTVALFNAKPGETTAPYDDQWYLAGRYAAQIGYYWTEHLKTEAEYATSNEGDLYLQQFQTPSAPGPVYIYSLEFRHRIEQFSLRATWQFGHNTWVHPYVTAGIVGERDRRRYNIPSQYLYSGPRAPVPTREFPAGATDNYRVGVATGAGAKIYLSQSAFFTTGALATWSIHRAATVSLLAGFGVDF